MLAALKHIHLTFVGLSFIGFILRGIWMMTGSSLLQAKLTKILPHVIDTILLLSAVILAVQLSINPASSPWLLAKIVGLILYVVLGTIAIKPGRPKNIRVGAFALALVCFIYIVFAAINKSPMSFFA